VGTKTPKQLFQRSADTSSMKIPKLPRGHTATPPPALRASAAAAPGATQSAGFLRRIGASIAAWRPWQLFSRTSTMTPPQILAIYGRRVVELHARLTPGDALRVAIEQHIERAEYAQAATACQQLLALRDCEGDERAEIALRGAGLFEGVGAVCESAALLRALQNEIDAATLSVSVDVRENILVENMRLLCIRGQFSAARDLRASQQFTEKFWQQVAQAGARDLFAASVHAAPRLDVAQLSKQFFQALRALYTKPFPTDSESLRKFLFQTMDVHDIVDELMTAGGGALVVEHLRQVQCRVAHALACSTTQLDAAEPSVLSRSGDAMLCAASLKNLYERLSLAELSRGRFAHALQSAANAARSADYQYAAGMTHVDALEVVSPGARLGFRRGLSAEPSPPEEAMRSMGQRARLTYVYLRTLMHLPAEIASAAGSVEPDVAEQCAARQADDARRLAKIAAALGASGRVTQSLAPALVSQFLQSSPHDWPIALRDIVERYEDAFK